MKEKQLSQTFKIQVSDLQLTIYLDSSYRKKMQNEPDYKESHYHTYYEVFFIQDGFLTIYTNNNTYNYGNGVVIISPFFNHFSRYTGKTYRLCFSFSKTSTSKLLENKILNTISKQVQYLQNDDQTFIFLEEINRLILEGNYIQEEIECLLKLVFLKLFKINGIIKVSTNKLIQKNYLAKIEQVIFSKFTNNISLSELAQIINLSERQISRIIKEHYGKTYSLLILEKKLDVASTLLKTTNLSVNEIIHYLNFNNESYFFKTFKKEFGITPYQYRKNNINK